MRRKNPDPTIRKLERRYAERGDAVTRRQLAVARMRKGFTSSEWLSGQAALDWLIATQTDFDLHMDRTSGGGYTPAPAVLVNRWDRSYRDRAVAIAQEALGEAFRDVYVVDDWWGHMRIRPRFARTKKAEWNEYAERLQKAYSKAGITSRKSKGRGARELTVVADVLKREQIGLAHENYVEWLRSAGGASDVSLYPVQENAMRNPPRGTKRAQLHQQLDSITRWALHMPGAHLPRALSKTYTKQTLQSVQHQPGVDRVFWAGEFMGAVTRLSGERDRYELAQDAEDALLARMPLGEWRGGAGAPYRRQNRMHNPYLAMVGNPKKGHKRYDVYSGPHVVGHVWAKNLADAREAAWAKYGWQGGPIVVKAPAKKKPKKKKPKKSKKRAAKKTPKRKNPHQTILPGSTIRLSGKAAEQAAKRYKKFHGHWPKNATVVQINDGKKGKTRKVVVALGTVPETHYQVPWDSNKEGYYWVHPHPKGDEPLEVLDPETDLTMKIPGSKTKVTDWWHD